MRCLLSKSRCQLNDLRCYIVLYFYVSLNTCHCYQSATRVCQQFIVRLKTVVTISSYC